jgi:hypothetical protein
MTYGNDLELRNATIKYNATANKIIDRCENMKRIVRKGNPIEWSFVFHQNRTIQAIEELQQSVALLLDDFLSEMNTDLKKYQYEEADIRHEDLFFPSDQRYFQPQGAFREELAAASDHQAFGESQTGALPPLASILSTSAHVVSQDTWTSTSDFAEAQASSLLQSWSLALGTTS